MRPTLPLLLFFFFFLLTFANSHVAATDDEVSALLSIKSGLVDPLGALHDWESPSSDGRDSSSHCNWTGVRCNPAGAVEALDLSHKNLSGHVVSGGIQRLPRLAHLNLCCNAFSSSLPSWLPNLTSLRELDLSDNQFVGRFPAGLGAGSPALCSLNASGNNFVGPLPEDVGNATSLETLDFRGSYFDGSIPSSYVNLQKLRFLGLSGNNLTGRIPPELGRLASLETLIVGYNEFEGEIPPELGNLTNLRYLDMAVGSLGDAIPPELGKLQVLDTVYLFRNNFDGSIPVELCNASSLVFLDLSDNQLTGSIPPELANLSNLRLLSLMCNKLSGELPSGLGELPHLEVLELWNNSLTGPLPLGLGRSSPLQWLDVSSNTLSGWVPPGVCAGGNLTKLILFNNGFSGPIPAGLSACPSLVRVRMQGNRLNGNIPTGLGKLPRLQRLELAGNELSGEIPDDISSSTSLSFVDLSGNRLQLTLPSGVLSIPTLQSFAAAGNKLVGGIPDQLQDCPKLSVLDLSGNRLSGSIPASLASCERLVDLNLRGNRLTGEIPAALATMPALAILDLSGNRLTGGIPGDLGSSPALEMVNVSYNGLHGPVPTNGVLRAINPRDLAGNPGICGGVLAPCSGGGSPEVVSPERQHLRHVVTGWGFGILVALAVGTMALGSRWAYRRWYLDGSGCCCCHGGLDQESEQWPWRLTAFQRVGFTSADVLACVKEANVVGMGATGIVYRAEMQRPHSVVAVKKLWRTTEAGDVCGGDMSGEVSLLGRLRHRNIVRLLGYLHNDADAMVLYEYMPNGSLWEALHGRQAGRLLLDWVSRYNVAAGVAQGLAYLHHDCHPPVVHRDVKSTNILLDAHLEARIADFGLARAMLRGNQTVSAVTGSYGYIAPEYGYTLKVDEKGDIYSFGVVLMELVTGKRPVEPEFGDWLHIVGWVREKLRRSSRGAEEELLDPDVGGRCPHVQEEMLLVLRIAVLCTARCPKDRPSMRDVLTMLGEAKPRRKSSSASAVVANAVANDKPVFTTSPPPDYL